MIQYRRRSFPKIQGSDRILYRKGAYRPNRKAGGLRHTRSYHTEPAWKIQDRFWFSLGVFSLASLKSIWRQEIPSDRIALSLAIVHTAWGEKRSFDESTPQLFCLGRGKVLWEGLSIENIVLGNNNGLQDWPLNVFEMLIKLTLWWFRREGIRWYHREREIYILLLYFIRQRLWEHWRLLVRGRLAWGIYSAELENGLIISAFVWHG